MHLKTNSAISKLDPFVDSNGLLRVGGCLKYANLNDDVKHPMILPKNSHVTSLLIRDFHERTLHQGKGITLNEIRSNGFWLIGGSSAVSNAIVSCVKCRKLRGPVVEQKMSDLPEDRVEASPPFSYCAVDYFGPFMIKEGRKCYGVLFTCMSLRAVHVVTTRLLWKQIHSSMLCGVSCVVEDPCDNSEATKALTSLEHAGSSRKLWKK